jgi:hypothetical protein
MLNPIKIDLVVYKSFCPFFARVYAPGLVILVFKKPSLFQ